jgi:alkanesulfonate monooxygenase SsuD/methylene tetrahydromethanopterin reductase-like flavin-dependent oxidoreductase (luciferase family)
MSLCSTWSSSSFSKTTTKFQTTKIGDFMHTVQFGFCLPIFAAPGARFFRTPNYTQLDPLKTLQLGQKADALGYDSLWVADHLMLGRDEAIMEGWTTLSALAGSTKRARLGMIHQGHFFRNPALAAKMTSTLDHLSQGRFIYFVDGGYGQREHHAYGLHYPATMEERMEEVVDGLELTLKLWAADTPLTHQGKFFQVTGAVNMPLPVQKPHPPVWFGEAHPSILAACARYGQGWNSVPVGYDEMKRRLELLAAACANEGRSIDELERSLETQILIAPDVAGVRASLQQIISLEPTGAGAKLPDGLDSFLSGATDELPQSVRDAWIIGTPDQVAAQVQSYVDLGISHFLFWFMDAPEPAGLELFAQAVAPRFRTA